MLTERKKVFVRTGMFDFSEKFGHFFDLDIDNPVAAIRRERIVFLRNWLKNPALSGKPTVVIFFEDSKGIRTFVYRSYREERRKGESMVLERDIMSDPDCTEYLISAVLSAYKNYVCTLEKWGIAGDALKEK